jgi:hypothetical protein
MNEVTSQTASSKKWLFMRAVVLAVAGCVMAWGGWWGLGVGMVGLALACGMVRFLDYADDRVDGECEEWDLAELIEQPLQSALLLSATCRRLSDEWYANTYIDLG